MISFKKIIAVLSILAWLSAPAFSTPPQSRHTRMVLLGTNDHHYFALVIVRHHPGSYYKSTEEMSIRKYSLKDERLIEEISVRATDYRSSDEAGSAVEISEKAVKAFNLGSFLMESKVTYAFPYPDLRASRLFITKSGIMLKGKKPKLVKSKAELLKSIPWYDEDTLVAALLYAGDHVFALLESGKAYGDMDYHEGLTLIKEERLQEKK